LSYLDNVLNGKRWITKCVDYGMAVIAHRQPSCLSALGLRAVKIAHRGHRSMQKEESVRVAQFLYFSLETWLSAPTRLSSKFQLP
jgi:hypothetical protein